MSRGEWLYAGLLALGAATGFACWALWGRQWYLLAAGLSCAVMLPVFIVQRRRHHAGLPPWPWRFRPGYEPRQGEKVDQVWDWLGRKVRKRDESE